MIGLLGVNIYKEVLIQSCNITHFDNVITTTFLHPDIFRTCFIGPVYIVVFEHL